MKQKVLARQHNIDDNESTSTRINPIVKSKIFFAIAQIFDKCVRMHFELSNIRAKIMNQALSGRGLTEVDVARLFSQRT